MRFYTNTGYANSKKWDGICFEKKTREIIMLCRINLGMSVAIIFKCLGTTILKSSLGYTTIEKVGLEVCWYASA